MPIQIAATTAAFEYNIVLLPIQLAMVYGLNM